ncbi:hypothetical protein [Escherichia coli]|uniref:hypothetical protein n=1 Tax=Escherichia coli TaxID=562 RepID=UPI0020199B0F|nr:hypothetical protein [Escherichia coli]
MSGVVWRSCGVSSALAEKEVAAGSALPGHAGHGLVGFQLCGLSVVCGLCRASIVAGLRRAGCKGTLRRCGHPVPPSRLP